MSEEVKTCSADALCNAMESRINKTSGVGLHASNTLNLETGKVRLLGIAYKTSAKDKGLLLNVCPWCRGEPGYFKRSTQ